MLIINADSTTNHIETMVDEALQFAKKMDVGVRLIIRGRKVDVFPFSQKREIMHSIQGD